MRLRQIDDIEPTVAANVKIVPFYGKMTGREMQIAHPLWMLWIRHFHDGLFGGEGDISIIIADQYRKPRPADMTDHLHAGCWRLRYRQPMVTRAGRWPVGSLEIRIPQSTKSML